MKVIFLDIDGVLTTPKFIKNGMWTFSPKCQEMLNQILINTDAKIVISSCWRHVTIQDTITELEEQGFLFSSKVIGITIRACHYVEIGIFSSIPRGLEIQQWLDTYSNKNNTIIPNYVILDDDCDMLLQQKNHFIKCNYATGLTKANANKAIKILNKKD